MHLLFLSLTYPDAGAPARGTYNAALCAALAERHSVDVVAPRGWGEGLRARLRMRRYALPKSASGPRVCYPTFWYPPGACHAQHGRFLWSSCQRAIRKLAAARTPDGVLSYWAHPDGEAGLRAAQALGVPHAVIVGGSDVLLLPRDRRRRDCVRRVLTESDAVVTVSDGLREAVVQLGTPAERVHTIYQGIDTDLFAPGDQSEARRRLGLPEEEAVLVWVGRMVPVKGLEILVEACAELQRRGRRFVLNLIGEGPERAALESLVRSRHLSDSIRCLGPIRPAELPDWYRAADVTVLSSWSEGLPNVLRESLACGTPFVATDVGSIREIASPEYSVLVAPGDAPGFAEAVEKVLEGSQRRAARRYKTRTWAECAAEVVKLFAHCDRMRSVSSFDAGGALVNASWEHAVSGSRSGPATL